MFSYPSKSLFNRCLGLFTIALTSCFILTLGPSASYHKPSDFLVMPIKDFIAYLHFWALSRFGLPLHHILRELFSAAVNLSFSFRTPSISRSRFRCCSRSAIYRRNENSFNIWWLSDFTILVILSLVLILGLEMKREDSCI